MQNSLEWLYNFWGILAAGYSPLLLNLRLDDSSLNEAIACTKCIGVISGDKIFAPRTVSEGEIVRRIKTLSQAENSGELTDEDRSFNPLHHEFGSVFFIMTSGTTSHGKVCAYTADRVMEILKNSVQIVKDSPLMKKHFHGELKQLTFLPFYHVFGMVAVYLWFGFYQRTFVELKDMTAETILTTIRRHEVTHIFAVPLFWDKVYQEAMKTIQGRGEKTWNKFQKGMALLDKLKKHPRISRFVSKLAFKEVREGLFGDSPSFLISGGGFIREEVLRFFNHIGYHLSNGYGMSEIGITSVELSDTPEKLISGTVGKSVGSIEYLLSDQGELLVRGTSMCTYVMEDGVRKDIPQNEWFETKDLCREENGRYFILGRRDDLVVAKNGENLNPNTIEEKLKMEGVQGICLSSMPTDGQNHPTLILSVEKHLSAEQLTEIKERAFGKIAECRLSESIERVVFTTDALIKGEEFKLNRRRIASDLREGRMHLVTPETVEEEIPEDEILDAVRRAFASALGKNPEDIGFTTDFFLDEGGTSMDFIAAISKLQEEFKITFPVVEDKITFTMKEIYEYVLSQVNHVDQDS